ncbi:hypothetical protein IQ260_28065, partial [Leptolyngbya cf. ectocarpi LEGE 11479]
SNTTYEFNEHPTDAEIQWESKLRKTLRLLDMAWAIAEAGCSITRSKKEDQSVREIKRSFTHRNNENQYTSKEIESVQDLYPRRVSEIAALGKIFSAACMVLLMHVVSSEEQLTIAKNINNILGMLHSSDRLINKTLRAHLARQRSYDGNLKEYLSANSDIIKRYIAEFKNSSESVDLKDYRDALIKELFEALHA